jgi:hypothetical protein
MRALANLTFIRKMNGLLRTCADWIRQHGRFGHPEKDFSGGTSSRVPAGKDFAWVYDPNQERWMMELTYSFRSFECRLQAGEADPTPGAQLLRGLLNKR